MAPGIMYDINLKFNAKAHANNKGGQSINRIIALDRFIFIYIYLPDSETKFYYSYKFTKSSSDFHVKAT